MSCSIERSVRGACAALLIVVSIVMHPAVASAHAGFDYSLPTNGATVGKAISEIMVAFTEPVTLVGNGFGVFDPQGVIRVPFAVTDDDVVFRLQIDPPLAGGEVGVIYEVRSQDDHVVSGGFRFTVGVDLPPTTTAPATTAPATTAPATTAQVTDPPVASTIGVGVGGATAAVGSQLPSLSGPPVDQPSIDQPSIDQPATSATALPQPRAADPASTRIYLLGAVVVAAVAAAFLAVRARVPR